MKRRKFIEQVSFITGGLLLSHNAAFAIPVGVQKIKGTVLSGGKGIANVIVSDGYSVIATDSKGQYEITPHVDARAVFVSTPSGYEFNHDKCIARHYSLLKKNDE
ncbi:MAG TPA: metallophosphoesterase N-terminal domain-containing protein, partial [Chitinophagaceae bacterium]|nr:metallophosphoesterase N-terminal domain-containing protein [Chitinophagaceae bacterium]